MTNFQWHALLTPERRTCCTRLSLERKNGLTYYSGLLRWQTKGSGMQFDFCMQMAGGGE